MTGKTVVVRGCAGLVAAFVLFVIGMTIGDVMYPIPDTPERAANRAAARVLDGCRNLADKLRDKPVSQLTRRQMGDLDYCEQHFGIR